MFRHVLNPPRRGLPLRVLVLLPALLLVAPTAATAKQLGSWGTAELEVGINSAQADGCPIESPNGLELFIASTRPGAVGGTSDPNDIWVARRATIDSAWAAPEHLPVPVNSAASDFCPTPLSGNRLYFVSTRGGAGACGAGDIFRTRLHPTKGWLDPERLGQLLVEGH